MRGIIALGAALLMGAAPAPHHAFGIEAGPAKVLALPGAIQSFQISDIGRSPVRIRASVSSLIRVHGKCTNVPLAPSWAHAAPATVALHSGQTSTVVLRLDSHGLPAGTSSILLDMVAIPPTHAKGKLTISGGVATEIEVKAPGHVSRHAPRPCLHIAAAVRPAKRLSWAPWALGGTLFTVALVMGIWAVLLRRHHGAHR
jgi:hypothetical protein